MEERRAYMKAYLKEYRRKNKDRINAQIKEYRLTKEGFVKKTHKDMISRCGRDKNYLGMSVCDKDLFVKWSLSDEGFDAVFNEWDHDVFTTTPAIDRIDASKGYVDGNMQWITFSENSIKGNIERTIKKQQL